jgi:hypothetical protein
LRFIGLGRISLAMIPSKDQRAVCEKAAQRLLNKAGLCSLLSLEPITGGANNRLMLAKTHCGEKVLIKSYFQSNQDPRDRFRHEQSFYRLGAALGIKTIPKMWAADEQERLSLFEFVEGRKLSAIDILQPQIRACATFFLQLNEGRKTPLAETIPIASEACFSLADHLALIHGRVNRLKNSLTLDSAPHREVESWVARELVPKWEKIHAAIRRSPFLDLPLNDFLRCISPSDFGFHNAIQSSRGLVFFDFEYAGWDDPAKMACDYFCQPEAPVPLEHLHSFLQDTCISGWDLSDYQRRVEVLFPAYRIKWACIILNVFLGVDAQRRRFADAQPTTELAFQKQLYKAQQQLAFV